MESTEKKYTVIVVKKISKFIESLSEPHYSAIINALVSLEENPRPFGYKKLTNDDKYRIRVGDYRILYKIFENIVTVEIVKVSHRKEVYKKR
ncbi:type II toxin-antitoxin system RelE/ParE family toxin [Capnocytophaga sp. 051621]|jgi:addiction module toxin, relE/stbE family|uniref:Type II toxin-antitoxin system RelE/ParE family toxin n=2 Tax=Capnocytophaga TaxID=1016 RepID=A0ABS1YYJ4_9FLAO|nr:MULTISPECIES: type II toxin-antitoxin system RelE/ParE family toxin [Capnocytophaga]MBI1647752.1 type II toxin-antitoxin system RelE/ParE family toxin [Capnocytophaga periodontitidis]MBM0651487.1 type II toxin-antitoxin system RelE/ParE family toxin [Capnocytophaga genosp. AHN8471]MBM0662882.1 type II toxin-antitoxin system RelE/ParE family toxin [Capnocytophaga genosp. AHN8471]